jgi:hypothetical protein
MTDRDDGPNQQRMADYTMRELIPEELRIPGTYEIYRQRRGLGPEYLVALDSMRNARNVMAMWADQERCCGLRIKNTDGGFSAYLRKGKVFIPFAHYWYEEVMPDDTVRIDADLMDAICVARTTAAAEVRQAEMDAQTDCRRSEQ